jgi:hypothetical protein
VKSRWACGGQDDKTRSVHSLTFATVDAAGHMVRHRGMHSQGGSGGVGVRVDRLVDAVGHMVRHRGMRSQGGRGER